MLGSGDRLWLYWGQQRRYADGRHRSHLPQWPSSRDMQRSFCLDLVATATASTASLTATAITASFTTTTTYAAFTARASFAAGAALATTYAAIALTASAAPTLCSRRLSSC